MAASTSKASLRAVFKAVEAKVHGSDKRTQGASTITQQVAKNFLLTNERSIERKIKEAILAIRIERAYSKDKILELYLNEIYLGIGSYGVAAAALSYFNKELNDLTIEEVAYLAALPKAPNNYHPFRAEGQSYRAPQLDHRPDGRERLHHRRRGRGRQRRSRSSSTSARPARTSSPAEFFAEEVRRTLLATIRRRQAL